MITGLLYPMKFDRKWSNATMQSFPFVYSNSSSNILLGLLTLITSASFAYDIPTRSEIGNKPIANAPNNNGELNANLKKHENVENYIFDPAFFQGSKLNQKALIRLSKGNEISAGIYKVDIYINNKFIENTNIRFKEISDNEVEPCFELEQLERAGVISQFKSDKETQISACEQLTHYVTTSSTKFNQAQLRLDLSIPQSLIKTLPRGYVLPSQLDDGASIGFVNYYANYYHNSYAGYGQSHQQNSAYLSLNGGMNFGKWQYRQQSSFTSQQDKNQWHNIRSYIKRPITTLQSEFSAGQLSSTGRFFSGLSFNGMNLSSDERMLPDSVRGYAPVVQGTAQTTAKVSILQNGREIYQTTVAPGPFKISDLYPTSYNGDLEVEVLEADGTRQTFRVPFSAVPESIRKGAFRYNLDIGRTRDIGEDTNFSNITTQYGLSNALTLNNGFRLAEGYQSALVGGAFTTYLGAFGIETTYSRAKLLNEDYLQGWMFGANYSKTFQNTNTTIALAGYRFSTEGYRDLTDVIALRKSIKDGSTFNSNTYQEQSRATILLNQLLGDYGTIYLSGSASRYRDDKPNDYQLQLGYGKTLSNGINLNLSVSRQKSIYQNSYNAQHVLDRAYPYDQKNQTTVGLSISFPLDKNNLAKNLNLNYNHSDQQNTYQATIDGNIERIDNLDYTLGVQYDDFSEVTLWNASLNKRFNAANTSFNISKGNDYWQSSANIQGALAVHPGGITFGPFLSDTFALIEAKGAYGASVLNAHGTKIDKKGFALVPALTPYRYNSIAINPEGMSSQTEIDAGNTKVAPYAGSTIKINFKTKQGHAVLIQSKLSSGGTIPLGSDVLNEKKENIGMTGQNGQIYFRTEQPAGNVQIRWGEHYDERCSIHYNIPDTEKDKHIIRLNEVCNVEN